MNRIDPAELAELARGLDEAFAAAGVACHVETDLGLRKRRVALADDPFWSGGRTQPTFDPPAEGEVDAFWLDVRPVGVAGGAAVGDAGMVAHCANRIFRDTTIEALFTDGALARPWGAGLRMGVAPGADLRDMAGTLAYAGSAWVHPSLRGRGLAGLLQLRSALALLERGDVDLIFASIRDAAAKAGMPDRYRFARLRGGLELDVPGAGTQPLWIAYGGRADMLDELRKRVAGAAAPVPA